MQVVLLENIFSRGFLHIFAIANNLPGFSIGGLPNMEDFWNVNVNLSISDYSSDYSCMHVT